MNSENTEIRLALSALFDQCPFKEIEHEESVPASIIINAATALVPCSLSTKQSTTHLEDIAAVMASSTAMTLISNKALSANRGKKAVTYTRQVKWKPSGKMQIVRKKKHLPQQQQQQQQASLEETSTILSFPVLQQLLSKEEEEDGHHDERTSLSSSSSSSSSFASSGGYFPCMHDWKRFADLRYWKLGWMEHFHGGYFRQCSALLSICLLRHGKFIIQRWMVHNSEEKRRRNAIQLHTIWQLYQWTKKHVFHGSFPILFHGLTQLSIDVTLNAGLAWLRADLVTLRNDDYPLEMFVLRVLPWFIRVFFLYMIPTSSTKCPITKLHADDVIPHLECTWMKRATINSHSLWNTMHVLHHNSVKTQTISIPLLGVRQVSHDFLHEEEYQLWQQQQVHLIEGKNSVYEDVRQQPPKPWFHSFLTIPSSSNENTIQTRSQTRYTLLTTEERKKRQEMCLRNIAATKQIRFQLPTLQSSFSFFCQLSRHAAATAASFSTSFQEWLQPSHWPLPSNGEIVLSSYLSSSSSGITSLKGKQMLIHSENEIP